jgi:hypothetical protein
VGTGVGTQVLGWKDGARARSARVTSISSNVHGVSQGCTHFAKASHQLSPLMAEQPRSPMVLPATVAPNTKAAAAAPATRPVREGAVVLFLVEKMSASPSSAIVLRSPRRAAAPTKQAVYYCGVPNRYALQPSTDGSLMRVASVETSVRPALRVFAACSTRVQKPVLPIYDGSARSALPRNIVAQQ